MWKARLAIIGALVLVAIMVEAVAFASAASMPAPTFASERAFPGTGA